MIQFKKLTITQKNDEIEKKIPNSDKHITTQELNDRKLMTKNITVRLKQTNLANQNDIGDFDENLMNINKKVTSIKTKHVESNIVIKRTMTKLSIFF